MKKSNDKNQPLVSVTVITYKSSKTVIETLESIKNQSYQNLELIISDDCSPDDTVAVCRDWIEKNKDRFVRTEIITVPKNTGTSANANRAIKACRGVFQKSIAGDDLLEPNCIETNLNGIGDADLAVSDMIIFDGFKELGKTSNRNLLYALAHLSPSKRLKLFCRTIMFFNPPSVFKRMTLYDKVGYFDEQSTVLEDVPFFVKLFKSDVKVVYIEEVTVRYRTGGISHSSESRLRLQNLLIKAYKTYCRQYLTIWNPLDALTILDFKFWDWSVYLSNPIWLRFYLSRYNILHRGKDYLFGVIALLTCITTNWQNRFTCQDLRNKGS